jgi:hypothetical protein
MKFMAKTTMYAATWRDMGLAGPGGQNTLADSPLAGLYNDEATYFKDKAQAAQKQQKKAGFAAVLWLIASTALLVKSVQWFSKIRKESKYAPTFTLNEPLVFG